MKLFYAPASPFVRKVMILLIETGVEPRVERLTSTSTPMKTDQALHQQNPLAKLPALVLDNGETLFDSRVICEYIDTTFGQGRFFPRAAEARWTALRRQAVADGLLDAGLLVRYETKMRPPEKLWDDWYRGQWAKVLGAMAEIEREAPKLGDTFDIGTIAIACALGYLDFRYPDFAWREGRSAATAWYTRFIQHPAMVQTMPRLS